MKAKTPDGVRYPILLRALGWPIACVMWGYPIDAFRIWWILRQYEPVRLPASTSPTDGGYLFDLQLGVTHAGPVGWLGSVACVFGLVWLATAGVLWVKYRLGSKQLDHASRMVFLAVGASVVAVFASHYLLWRVFGILVT